MSFAALTGAAAATAAASANSSNSSTGAKATQPSIPPLRSALTVEPGWSIHNPLLCHLFIIDAAARVRWRAVGPPMGDDLHIAERLINELRKEQREGKGDSVIRAARRTQTEVLRANAGATSSANSSSGSARFSKGTYTRVTVSPPVRSGKVK